MIEHYIINDTFEPHFTARPNEKLRPKTQLNESRTHSEAIMPEPGMPATTQKLALAGPSPVGGQLR